MPLLRCKIRNVSPCAETPDLTEIVEVRHVLDAPLVCSCVWLSRHFQRLHTVLPGNHNDCERSRLNHHLLTLTTLWKGTDGLRRPNTAKELLSGRRILWKVHCHFWGCPHPNASIRQWDLLWLTMFSRVEKSAHLSRLIRENKIHRSSWKIKRETYRI